MTAVDSTSTPPLSDRQHAEISALADGSLSEARRPEVEARVVSSPQLRAVYERERRAVEAVQQAGAMTQAPPSLRARIEARQRGAGGRPRLRVRYVGALAAALAAIALLIGFVVPEGAPGGPSVSRAAALASRGASASAPQSDARAPEAMLDQRVGRVYFPNWLSSHGWAAVGQRSDQLTGRRVVTVYYQGHNTTVAYSIVGGPVLTPPAGKRVRRDGVPMRTFSVDGRLAVTWRRGGHTCVLSGMGVTAAELEQLASWRYR